MDRAKIARASLENRGGCILVNDIDHAIEWRTNTRRSTSASRSRSRWPTHEGAERGGLFLGEGSAEAIGDYTAGPSHTMPTGGSARWSGPLSVRDFLKSIAVVNLPETELDELARAAEVIARAEGLTGQAPTRPSVGWRCKGRGPGD